MQIQLVVMEIAMVVTVVAENSGIKDKAKLMAYLYKNPAKLALKLSALLKDSDDGLLEPVRLKGKGRGYYYSVQDKKFLCISRDAEFYLLPWEDKNNSKKCYIYSHGNWLIGCIFNVFKDEIEYLGYN